MNQKGFSVVAVLTIIFTFSVVGFASWYVWNENQDDETEQAELVQSQEQLVQDDIDGFTENFDSPELIVYENDRFEITLPEGWQFSQKTGNIDSLDNETNESYRFENGDNFFEVNYVVAGRGVTSDLFWAYRVDEDFPNRVYLDSSGLEICDPVIDEVGCSSGNGKLDIFIKGGGSSADSEITASTVSGGSATVSFWAGNSSLESVEDTAIQDFRSMINSIRFKKS